MGDIAALKMQLVSSATNLNDDAAARAAVEECLAVRGVGARPGRLLLPTNRCVPTVHPSLSCGRPPARTRPMYWTRVRLEPHYPVCLRRALAELALASSLTLL